MNGNPLAMFALQAALLAVLFMVYHFWGFNAALAGIAVLVVVTMILNSRS